MSDDWIPVPEIENVLIVMATLADEPEALAQAPAFALLQQLKDWHEGSVYVFHAPPEAGEILEDVDAEMGARFVLAAQMADTRAEACRDAFRRVFGRADVKRAVLVTAEDGHFSISEIDAAFAALRDGCEVVWKGEWPMSFALGMTGYHEEIFTPLPADDVDLRNLVAEKCAAAGLKYCG